MAVTHGASVSGEFGSLVELLALCDDVGKYKTKIAELDGRIASAKQVFAKASAENDSAKGHRTIAEKLMHEAEAKLAEAKAAQTIHAANIAALEQRTKAHDARETTHHASVAKFEAHRASVEADLKARHVEVDNKYRGASELQNRAAVAHANAVTEAKEQVERATLIRAAAEQESAKLADKRKRFLDFVAEVKAWDRD